MPPKRKHYTPKEKLDILDGTANMSVREAAQKHGIDPSMISRWKKSRRELEKAVEEKKLIIHPGKTPTFSQMDPILVQWVLDKREMDEIVTNDDMIMKGATLDRGFRVLSEAAQRSYIDRLKNRNRLTLRKITHRGQKILDEILEEARDFQISFERRCITHGYSLDSIWNMDETPVYFEPTQATTIDVVGRKHVPAKSTGKESTRATAALTVSASGEKLAPFLIFKAQHKKTVWREVTHKSVYPHDVECSTQSSAWMDKELMLEWIERFWKPYTMRHNRPTLLLLDKFSAHMCSSVVSALNDLQTEVEFLPPGCTCAVQPVDVGINKPLKDANRRKWRQFMFNCYEQSETVQCPSRLTVANWISENWNEISIDTIRNSWKTYAPYPWFIE